MGNYKEERDLLILILPLYCLQEGHYFIDSLFISGLLAARKLQIISLCIIKETFQTSNESRRTKFNLLKYNDYIDCVV